MIRTTGTFFLNEFTISYLALFSCHLHFLQAIVAVMATLASHVAKNNPLKSTSNYTNSYSDILKMNKEAESMVAPLLLTSLAGEETGTIAENSVHSSNGDANDAGSVSVYGSANSIVTSSISSSNLSGTSKSEKIKNKVALSAEEKKAALIEVNYLCNICVYPPFFTHFRTVNTALDVHALVLFTRFTGRRRVAG